MFTGIVQETGIIQKAESLNGGGMQFSIACSFADSCHIDESIAINGACHTVTAFDADTFTVQSVEETLRKTTMGLLKEGTVVNLERSMTFSGDIANSLSEPFSTQSRSAAWYSA